jgi:hypothetical protein
MTLSEFLRIVAADPILVDDFRADPDAVLERSGVDRTLWPLLKGRDDVALLLEVRKEQKGRGT